jgi:hypothetical protein
MTSPSAVQDNYPYKHEPIWSRSEKTIARKAFDAALGRELHEVIQEAKMMASQIKQSSDLWDLEHYLTQRRKEIDRKYDFRGSRLIWQPIRTGSTSWNWKCNSGDGCGTSIFSKVSVSSN